MEVEGGPAGVPKERQMTHRPINLLKDSPEVIKVKHGGFMRDFNPAPSVRNAAIIIAKDGSTWRMISVTSIRALK